MASEFEIEVARLMMQFNTPGVAVEMLARGKRYSAHAGRLTAGGALPVTQKARFSTMCLIKLLINLDLLMLAEKGQISLDDKLADHLPDLGKGPTAKGNFLNIRHLMSHTGGFRSCPLPHLLPLAQSWQNCVDLLHDAPQLFEPGTVFEDDHLSHIILGELLSRLRGKPIVDVVREDVLRPLGIHPSTRPKDAENPEIYVSRHMWNRDERKWEPEDDIYPDPDPTFGAISPLSMTSVDLFRLGEILLADQPDAKASIVSPRIEEKLFSPVIRIPREISLMRHTRWRLSGFGLGMGTFRDGQQGFVTTGRGQSSCIIFDEGRQSVLTIAMNTLEARQRETLLNTLLAKFAKDTSIKPEPTTLDIGFDEFIHPFTTRDICGAYMGFTPEPVEIFANPRSFIVRVQNEDRYQFEAGPENQLIMKAKTPLSIGLFPDPVSKRPCVSIAMHPFRKVA
jgi:CubicO group peptidase (beta-lactamase class C family)